MAPPTSHPHRPLQGPSRASRRPRRISLNAWLIAINVAVFLLNSFLASVAPLVRTPWGTEFLAGVTPAEMATGLVDRTRTLQHQSLPGVFYHPIVSPTPLTDPQGRVLVNLHTGEPVRRELGRERFTLRPLLDSLGHFSAGKLINEWQIWRLVTFQFLHVNLVHLLFNMLGLAFVGGIVEEYLGPRRYGALYLACGACGAIAYLVLNVLGYLISQFAPGLAPYAFGVLFADVYTPLVGASAGVFGVLMAAAFIAPDDIVDVMLVFRMRLRAAVYLFFTLAVFNLLIGGHNAGGDAAHVGGALAGAYFIRRTHHLRNMLNVFRLDTEPSRRGTARPPLTPREQAELDRIVAKTGSRGLSSLTPEERAALRRINAKLGGGLA